jgi:exodeoxyribonuclease VII large subunit
MRVGRDVWERSREAVAIVQARLGDLSPLSILSRGYAVCYGQDGTSIVKSISDVSIDDTVRVRVGDGRIGATVIGVEILEER